MTNVQVKKAITSYPNLHWLCSASEESYKEVFGNKTGSQIYNFIRNPELVTEEWRNKHFQDGTDKIQLPELEICDKIKEAIVDYLTEQCPHALTVDELCNHFNIAQGDEDKEAFLIYIKELAWEKKITNIVSGEFTITKELQSLSNRRIDKDSELKNRVETTTGTRPNNDIMNESMSVTHDTKLQSRCDPAGTTFLDKPPKTPPKTIPPTDDNDKGFYKVSVESFEVLPLSPLEKVVAKTWANKYNHNDKSSEVLLPPLTLSSEPLFIKRNVQKKDLKKLASSSKSLSSPAITSNISDSEADFEPLPYTVGTEIKLSTHRMSARVQLESFLQSPHTLQECVDKHDNFTKGVIWEHIARMKKEGVIMEFDNKTLVMTK